MNKRPSPGALIADLIKYADWEPADSPRGAAMREAALLLKQLTSTHEDDEVLAARSFSIETHVPSAQMRMSVYRDTGQQGILAYMIISADEVHDLSKALMKAYDKLEGIE